MSKKSRRKRRRKNRNRQQYTIPPKEERRGMPYLTYLASSWWNYRRGLALKQAGYKCSQCGCTKNLQVHHLCYFRLWAERESDLHVLCRPCHQHEHEDIIQAESHLRAIMGQSPLW